MNKRFSLSSAVIAALLATSAAPALAQVPAKSKGNTASLKAPKGGTNVGGYTSENTIGEGGTNVGGYVGYSSKEGSTNVGGSEDGINIYSVNPWDSGIQNAIMFTKQSATDNFADNKIDTAIKIYELQLEKISQTASAPELQLSWTKKVADRTLDLTSRLESTITNADDRMAIFNVYATTYDLLEEFYAGVDKKVIIPYQEHKITQQLCAKQTKKDPACGKEFQFDLVGFEYQLNQYVVRHAEWFAQRFVAGTNSYGTLPQYSPTVFLVALSSTAKGLAADLLDDSVLGPNLFPTRYQALASTLNSIAEHIDQHLAGGTVYSGRDDRAINNSYKRFQQVVAEVRATPTPQTGK